jgi:hypothetical protein
MVRPLLRRVASAKMTTATAPKTMLLTRSTVAEPPPSGGTGNEAQT